MNDLFTRGWLPTNPSVERNVMIHPPSKATGSMSETQPLGHETPTQPSPTSETDRIQSLDVLRGFALLGILLLNILGFGFHSSGLFNPLVGTGESVALNLGVWATVDVLFEGAMRCLFSILFGAGVVLFATTKAGSLHYKRNFWLVVIGLFDGFILLWNGDILITYALAGALLYVVRGSSPKRLLIGAIALIVAMSAMNATMSAGLALGREASEFIATATSDETITSGARQGAAVWEDFEADYNSPDMEVELVTRRASYSSAFNYNTGVMVEMLVFTIPVLLFWDALAMMLLGMALYKWNVLNASRSASFYLRFMVTGFTIGLATNIYEVSRGFSSDFEVLSVFGFMQPTYHVGRLGMAAGYLGLVMLICKFAWLPATRMRLAAVGRMALTNYLMHSLIALVIFTGAGFALVGTLERWMLYVVVLGIWIFQLFFSPWWLARYRFGPLEWMWRALTYGSWPNLRR